MGESLGFCALVSPLLPLPAAEPEPLGPLVCDQACGAMTNTAPLNSRLDTTFFFISSSLIFFLLRVHPNSIRRKQRSCRVIAAAARIQLLLLFAGLAAKLIEPTVLKLALYPIRATQI
jgi:hypothetical protein